MLHCTKVWCQPAKVHFRKVFYRVFKTWLVNYIPFRSTCSFDFIVFQETAGAPSENEAHPRRLQFGFAPELEKLVHDKVESSVDLYVHVTFLKKSFVLIVSI